MKRLAGSVIRDFRVQLRSGYPWINITITLFIVLLIKYFIPVNFLNLLPVIALTFSLFTTLPFLLLQIHDEIRNESFALLDITPLRPHEYIVSKAISLFLSSLLCNISLGFIMLWSNFNLNGINRALGIKVLCLGISGYAIFGIICLIYCRTVFSRLRD